MAPMGQRYRQKKRWIKTDPTKITRISAPPIENIGFTPGRCPMELYCPNTCHGPAMFHFIIPLHTKTAQNRSTPYLIQPVGTFLPLFFDFECRFFAPAFRNRFFSLFPANHRKSCTAPKLQKYPQKNRPTIITAGTGSSARSHCAETVFKHCDVPDNDFAGFCIQ